MTNHLPQSHTARKIIEFLKQQKVDLLNYPPNSLDLSSNYFITFPKIKNRPCMVIEASHQKKPLVRTHAKVHYSSWEIILQITIKPTKAIHCFISAPYAKLKRQTTTVFKKFACAHLSYVH